MVQLLWRTVWRLLKKKKQKKKLKMELPYNPVILFLGIYLEQTKILI